MDQNNAGACPNISCMFEHTKMVQEVLNDINCCNTACPVSSSECPYKICPRDLPDFCHSGIIAWLKKKIDENNSILEESSVNFVKTWLFNSCLIVKSMDKRGKKNFRETLEIEFKEALMTLNPRNWSRDMYHKEEIISLFDYPLTNKYFDYRVMACDL